MSHTNYIIEDEKDDQFRHAVSQEKGSQNNYKNLKRRSYNSNYNANNATDKVGPEFAVDPLAKLVYERAVDSPLRIYEKVIMGDCEAVCRFLEKFPHRATVPNPDGYQLVHLAVMHNRMNILTQLGKLESVVDFAATDQEERTPLHHAVIAELPHMVKFILTLCPHVTILDHYGMMPIHLAAETGNVEIMEMLIPYYYNLSAKGESGFTAMHYAAANNNAKVIRLLIQHGVSPFLVCNNGNYPIHLAAKNAATEALRAIVEEYLGTHKGKKAEALVALRDREGNMTIHAAVNSGDIETVEACLNLGSDLTSQQEEGLTALHLAATQGSLNMLKVMAEYPKEFAEGIKVLDVLCRTPLHWATIFDHAEVIEFLMKKGAEINVLDLEENSPLLTAASKGSWKSLNVLLSGDADTTVKDINNRNFIHLMVLSLVVDANMGTILQAAGNNLTRLLNDRDHFGFTPLHYAAKYGHLTALNELINLGCALNSKSNKKQTALHLAAQFGRYNTCVTMLQSSTGSTLKNEPDGTGMAALHLAVISGHAKIVSLLLQRGTGITKDDNSNTPLHLAASKGQVECMQILLGTNFNLLNMTNKEGDTPLHLAALNGHAEAVTLLLSEGASILRNNNDRSFSDEVISSRHQDVAHAIVMHVRWEEVCQHLSAVYGTFLVGLVKNLPHICQIVLDRCVISSNHDPSSEDYCIEYNFTYLNLPSNFFGFAEMHQLIHEPLLPLQEMVKHDRVECLSHPLCINFLRMKWRKYGIHLHFLEMAIYLMYLYALTDFVYYHDSLKHYDGPDWTGRSPNDTYEQNSAHVTVNLIRHVLDAIFKFPEEAHFSSIISYKDHVFLMFIVGFSVVGMIKEIFVFFIVGLHYMSAYRLMEWLVYISALIFVTPFLGDISVHVQWQFGVICVFSSWFNCLVQLHRFDLFGIYVVMFLEIMKTLIQVVLIFSVLNIAFGLAFYVLMAHEENKGFRTPLLSVYRTLILITEIDYMSNFNEPYHDENEWTLHFREETLILLGIFILLMPILLMNLLIGLAVGDIEAVQRGARLKRLATQVEFHSRAENMFPYLRKLTEERFMQYPNMLRSQFKNFYYKMFGMMEMMPRETLAEEDSFIARQLNKHETKLQDIYNKCEKNNSLMNRIMKRLHMSLEEEIWDEGSIFIEGIGEPEEVRVQSFTQRVKAGMRRFTKKMLF